ncbi:anthrone oxygenase family protein [Mycobacterium sp.]|uniref:anthrone oxygenase family protein n=1 Tax=Mycobacterium sp. TaxID=1785 RepID=UPI003C76EBCE
MNHVIDALAVVITGPLVGVESAVAVFFNPLVARLPDDAFRAARGRAGRVLGAVMPFWYVATLLLLGLTAVRAGGGPRGWLCGAAAGLMAGVVLLTVTMLVPINNRIAKWPTTGELSRELAARWDRRHRLRVVVLLVLFVLLTVAVT